jgi:ABC-2 type transport system permease protein
MKLTTTKTPRAAFNKLLLNEFRLSKRVPISPMLGLGLPILLLIIFGSIPATSQASKALGGQSYFALSFPILLSLTVMSLSIVALPRALVSYRETGILRRLSTTPAPPSWLLAAQVVVNLIIAVVGLVILTVVGAVAFHLNAPKDWFGFLIAIILTIASMFTIGLCIAATSPNNGVSQAIGGILFYVLLFFGGIWIPRPIMPHLLLLISNWIPFGAAVGAMQSAIQGTFPTTQSLLCLAGCTLVFGYLAVRYFKWE